MPTLYPGALDIFSNPTQTSQLDSVLVPHAKQHSDVNDSVTAIETHIGVVGSQVSTTVEFRLSKKVGYSTTVPLGATSPGVMGQQAFNTVGTNSYLYVCVAPNTWRRLLLSTWI